MYVISELPGVYFREKSSLELEGSGGGKIPVIIGKTGNTTTYEFVSYDANTDEEIGAGVVGLTGTVYGNYSEVEVLTNSTDQDYVGRKFYVETNAVDDGETKNILYSDAGNTETGIVVTVNSTYKTDGTSYLVFNKVKDALADVVVTGDDWESQTGIGLATDENNELAQFLQEFYDESKAQQSTDVSVSKIYIIDVGDGTNVNAWEQALETAKTLTDAEVEVYVGAEGITDCTLEEFTYKAVDSIYEDTEDLDLRYGFITSKKLKSESLKEYDNRLISLAFNLRPPSPIPLVHPLLVRNPQLLSTPASPLPVLPSLGPVVAAPIIWRRKVAVTLTGLPSCPIPPSPLPRSHLSIPKPNIKFASRASAAKR